MSIDFDDMPMLEKRYEKIEKKVISVLGFNPLNSNHYFEALLYGERIDLETPSEKITEIYNQFNKLYADIEDIFNQNHLELKNEYFMVDDMYGSWKFLGTTINVNIGIKGLLPTINDFIKISHKIQLIAPKFGGIDERYFYKISRYYKTNGDDKYGYMLYGVTIDSDISVLALEEIILRYYHLNLRVNQLLEISNYKNKNLIYPRENTYFLFAQKINEYTSNEEILKIINLAQLLENNLQCALHELKITGKWEIKYTEGVWLWSESSGSLITLNMNYEDIKRAIVKKI